VLQQSGIGQHLGGSRMGVDGGGRVSTCSVICVDTAYNAGFFGAAHGDSGTIRANAAPAV
jgi:hypothetical protein